MVVYTIPPEVAVKLRDYKGYFGESVFSLACHVAFPLTFTSDLVYCLRENFLAGQDWFMSPRFLMSGLCNSIGYDLYELDAPLRRALLQQLVENYGSERIEQLAVFMEEYIQHRLAIEAGSQANRLMGIGVERDWVALSCLRPREAYQAIERYLEQISALDDRDERLRLASVLDSYADFFDNDEFQPVLLNWANRAAEGQPINDRAEIALRLRRSGFPLQTLNFEQVTLVTENQEDDNQNLLKFSGNTVVVDGRGEIMDTPQIEAFYFEEQLGEGVSPLKMIAIRSGEFQMGSSKGEGEDFEYLQHWVQVPPFFMSQTPITQAQWKVVVEAPEVETTLHPNPSVFPGENRPVEQVSWEDAVEFCRCLTQLTRRQEYRLPTEVEWEYACRAGSTTNYTFGDTLTDQLAQYRQSYSTGTNDVGKFPANVFGLLDMHGNVWEWCQDTWHDNYEDAPADGSAWIKNDNDSRCVLRGGSWFNDSWLCRSAYRFRYDPVERFSSIGFRVVLSLPRNPSLSELVQESFTERTQRSPDQFR